MSNDFYGRQLVPGFNSFQIDICEICLQKTPNWVEIKGTTDKEFEIRLTCNNCHTKLEIDVDNELYERNYDETFETQSNVRSGWVDDFLAESTGIENIDLDTQKNTDDEVPEKINWIKGFIDEALFGSNPINWMEKRGLFKSEIVDETIHTLGELSTNDLPSVKLAAIQSLEAIYERHKDRKDKIHIQLQKFENDLNDVVVNFANEILKKVI